MQKDIARLATRQEALTKKGAAPEGLPVESPKPSKPDKPKSTIPAPSKKYGPYYILGKAFSRQAIISVIFIAIILLIAGGVYYWWNYLRVIDEIEVIESLEINIPADVSDVLGEKYTFFLYANEQGNRAGFVVQIIDHEVLKAGLRDWENTMKEDLELMFLEQELDESTTEEFQDNIYRDIDIRYLNFPDPSLTIDYAIVEDYLVITTSRESMYVVIDRINP